MPTRRLSIRTGLAAALAAGLALAAPARAGELLIETSLADDGALRVRYTPPAGERQITLLGGGDGTRRVWAEMARPADDCTQIDAAQRKLQLREGCSRAEIRIRPGLLAMYATYEVAQDIGGTGLLSHTSHFVATVPGHDLRWRWLPPSKGYLLLEGQVRREPAELRVEAATLDAALADPRRPPMEARMVYLGRAEPTPLPGGELLRDPRLDEARFTRIRDTLVRVLSRLDQLYGERPAGPVAVITSTAEMQGHHGDVDTLRMMRLRLDADAERDRQQPDTGLRLFVTHEAVHWWNMGVYRSDPDRPWMHEGHASWMALLLSAEQRPLAAEDWQREIEGALNRCLMRRGNLPSAALPPGYPAQDDPYACGQTLMMAAQLQRARPGDRPAERLATLHRGRRTVLSPADFGAWADDGADGPMQRLLLDPALGFRDGLRALLAPWIDEQPLRPGQPLPAALSRQLGMPLMAALMQADCGGTDFWTLNDGFRLGTQLRCAHLVGGQELVTLQQVPLTDPVGAWQAVRAACAAGTPLRAGDRQGGSIELPCPQRLPEMPLQALWRLKPAALSRLGLVPG